MIKERGYPNAIVDVKLWLERGDLNIEDKALYERVLTMLKNKEILRELPMFDVIWKNGLPIEKLLEFNNMETAKSKAEKFETEGFSEYQNGFIEGFNSNKSCDKAIADIRNKMGYISNLLSLLEINEKDEYIQERIKELIPKSIESIEWLRTIKTDDYEN